MIFKTGRLNSLFILVLLVGYILTSFMPGIIGTDSRVVTIPFRALVLGLSLYIMFRGVVWKGRKTFPAWQWTFFVAFWIIYLFRIIYDLYYVGIKATVYPRTSDYLLNAVGVCLLPAIAIRYADNVDFSWVLKWFFRLLLIALSLTLVFNLSNPLDEDVTRNGQYQGSSAMNTISYGHYGVTFALLSMFLFSKSVLIHRKLFYVACFFFGLFIMYLAGSRSPLVALLVCSLFFQVNNTGLFKGLLVIALLTLPLIIFGDQIIEFLSGFGGSFIHRVLLTIKSGNSSGRDVLYAQSYQEFLASPIFGNAFLMQGGIGTGFYPHNMILEAFMALGILGGLTLLAWIFKCLRMAYKLISASNESSWVGVLFLQYFIYALFSMAIFNNAGFWYYSVLIWNVAYIAVRRSNKISLSHRQVPINN